MESFTTQDNINDILRSSSFIMWWRWEHLNEKWKGITLILITFLNVFEENLSNISKMFINFGGWRVNNITNLQNYFIIQFSTPSENIKHLQYKKIKCLIIPLMCYINLFHLDVYLVSYVRDIYVKTLHIGKHMNKIKKNKEYNETYKLFS